MAPAPQSQDMYAYNLNKEEDDYIHEAGFEYERHAEPDFGNVSLFLCFADLDYIAEGLL